MTAPPDEQNYKIIAFEINRLFQALLEFYVVTTAAIIIKIFPNFTLFYFVTLRLST